MKTYTHTPQKSRTRREISVRAFGLLAGGAGPLNRVVAMRCSMKPINRRLVAIKANGGPRTDLPHLQAVCGLFGEGLRRGNADTQRKRKRAGKCIYRLVEPPIAGVAPRQPFAQAVQTVPMCLSVQNRSNACACWRAGFDGGQGPIQHELPSCGSGLDGDWAGTSIATTSLSSAKSCGNACNPGMG